MFSFWKKKKPQLQAIVSNFNYTKQGQLAALPPEIWLAIVCHLTPVQACTQVALVNHSMNAIIQQSHDLWKFYLTVFGIAVDASSLENTSPTTTTTTTTTFTTKIQNTSPWKVLFVEHLRVQNYQLY